MNAALESVLARELSSLLSPASILRCHEALGQRTTLRVGGAADIYVEPASEADLGRALLFCHRRSLPCFVLGRGSNLLVKDAGYHGVVLCLAHPVFSSVGVSGLRVRCGAGARLKSVAQEAKRHEIAGLEFLEGIPGSVGGALRMNAGAMGNAIFERVDSVRLMNMAGEIQECPSAEMGAEYRQCARLKSSIALSATLHGEPGRREAIERRMNEFSQRRWSSQPAAASAGCMFKNPAQIPAGRLIDELGLKGARVGGAMVSSQHGNFLVNDGSATAQDVLDLIELVRARARTERGIELETEVEIIGD